MARIVSIALRNITVVFDPELVIFQGDFAYADDHFNRRLIDYMNEFQYYSTSEPFAVRYDRRDLFEMDASGAFIALQENISIIPTFTRTEQHLSPGKWSFNCSVME